MLKKKNTETSEDYWHVVWVEVLVCRQTGSPWKNSLSP